MKTTPTIVMIDSFSCESALPRIASIIFRTIFPPSSTGIGKRLTIPKLIESIAKRLIIVGKPALAAWPLS